MLVFHGRLHGMGSATDARIKKGGKKLQTKYDGKFDDPVIECISVLHNIFLYNHCYE